MFVDLQTAETKGMVLAAPDADLYSIGRLCALLQASPRRIESAAIAAGIHPVLRLNGIIHFSDDQIMVIRKNLQADKDS